MAVTLRLSRMGRKKRPFYRIVAVDKRRKRDGAFIERIGHYHPLDDPPGIKIDAEKALKWLRVGAQPSNTVRSLLRKEGVWLRFRLEKRGMPEKQIAETMADWFARNELKVKAVDSKETKKEAVSTEVETAETTEETKKTDAPVEEVVEEAAAEEAPAEEAVVEEAPAEETEQTEEAPAEDSSEDASEEDKEES